MCVRGTAAVKLHRASRPLPLVTAAMRAPAPQRVGAEGQGRRRLPPAPLPRPLQDPGEQPLRRHRPLQAAAALAGRPLPGGREREGPAARRRRQVPRAPQVPAAAHHLGRRGDELLLQGEVAHRAQRVVCGFVICILVIKTRIEISVIIY